MRSTAKRAVYWLLTILMLVPSVAHAQASITGTVRDASGAVLPGVTVEAASPALIEKVRSVVTDNTGQYRIIDLRPGTYAVSFTLTGFNVVRREGIELTGSLTATVNADLRVGGIEETITVTGESPIVDVQSATQQRVLGKDVVDAIPTGRSHTLVAILIPGITGLRDVGGTSALSTQGNMAIHGGSSNDSRVLVDGMTTQNSEASGGLSNHMSDMGGTQEVTVDYAGGMAEQAYAGIRINIVPREGGNTFRGSSSARSPTTTSSRATSPTSSGPAGLGSPNTLKRVYDVNVNFGGPIMRDKVWFFTGARWVENNKFIAGRYFNLNAGNPNAWTYEPDLSRQSYEKQTQRTVNGRVTWQATQRNKFGFSWDDQDRCLCQFAGGVGTVTPSPEAMSRLTWPVNRIWTASWSSPVTSRLLLEVRGANRHETYDYPDIQLDGTRNYQLVQVTEQSTGLTYRSMGGIANGNRPFQETASEISQVAASLSYVTGAHSAKFGFTDVWASRASHAGERQPFPYSFRFNNGVPNQITQFAVPYANETRQRAEMGLYAQDKWTLERLTVNGGVRFDYYGSYFPEQFLGSGPLFPNRAIRFPETEGLSFKDVTPRVGAAYDLFGNGRTAIKGNVGRYPTAVGIGQQLLGENANPALRIATTVTRSWNDRGGLGINGDYVPQCDLVNPLANGECGTISDLSFGQPIPSTNLDPDIITGWDKRPYQWEFTAAVQQQLAARVSMNVGYFRRAFGNFTVTDNLLVGPSDYSPYQITAPLDSRLPNGGGYVITGLYDLNPNKVGQVSNLARPAADFGKQIQHWNGVDVTVDARLQRSVIVQGGVSTGRQSTDNCDVATKVDNPTPLYCKQVENFLTQVKFLGAYTVPRVDVQVAATFQSLPGPVVLANYNAPNALIQPSLGRPLAGGAANATVNLVEPGTMFGERLNQLDLRFTKIFRIGSGYRAHFNLDLYNALNLSPVVTQNNNFAAWQVPLTILNARLVKISAQFDF